MSSLTLETNQKGSVPLQQQTMPVEQQIVIQPFRYYKQRLPMEGDLVVARVTKILEMGAECSLLEYNDHMAMIMVPEAGSRSLRRRLPKVQLNHIYPCVVKRVDPHKGYIDLNIKLTDQDKNSCMEKYNKAKCVHSIAGAFAAKNDIAIDKMYHAMVFPLYGMKQTTTIESQNAEEAEESVEEVLPQEEVHHLEELLDQEEEQEQRNNREEKVGKSKSQESITIAVDESNGNSLTAYESLKLCSANAIKAALIEARESQQNHQFRIKDETIFDKFIAEAKRKLDNASSLIKLSATVDVRCFSEYGVNGIKDALLGAMKKETQKGAKVDIRLIAPPYYSIEILCGKREDAEAFLKRVTAHIESAILSKQGTFKLKEVKFNC